MKKAAAWGWINFREARLLDRHWWRRLNWLLEEVEDKEARDMTQLRFSQHAAALEYTAGKEAFDHHWKALNDLYSRYLKLAFPWIKSNPADDNKSVARKWIRAYEDISSAEMQERIRATVGSLEMHRNNPSSAWHRPGQ